MTKPQTDTTTNSIPARSATPNATPNALGDNAMSWENWPEGEKELLREVALAVRSIRFGSIVLTIHNGQLQEVSKNIRIRRNKAEEKE